MREKEGGERERERERERDTDRHTDRHTDRQRQTKDRLYGLNKVNIKLKSFQSIILQFFLPDFSNFRQRWVKTTNGQIFISYLSNKNIFIHSFRSYLKKKNCFKQDDSMTVC